MFLLYLVLPLFMLNTLGISLFPFLISYYLFFSLPHPLTYHLFNFIIILTNYYNSNKKSFYALADCTESFAPIHSNEFLNFSTTIYSPWEGIGENFLFDYILQYVYNIWNVFDYSYTSMPPLIQRFFSQIPMIVLLSMALHHYLLLSMHTFLSQVIKIFLF